jgi:hypothetical protein
VFYLQFETTLKPSHPEFRSVARATIWCWVDVPTAERADEVARAAIDAEEYVITGREEFREVTRDEFTGYPQALACFDEAAESGASFFYMRSPA